MTGQGQMKTRGGNRVNAQQVVFELKQRVVVALNKLGDRDTCQIGVDELEKIAEGLSPDGIAPFLSCVLDTDKEQKSAVRKECVRLLGNLVSRHENVVGPYLGRMVSSVVNRLKDSDSVVRDACVETMGVLASKLGAHESESDGVFVGLVKPLFEALGEQNKQMQSGAALCLARVVEITRDPPVTLLQRMLSRTIKLLKNPHFMAKPAVIELNRSIIQVGGAPSKNVLSAAMTSIQEALKDSDWTTRKAASVALGDIASTGASCLGSFKASCIRSLESSRFDKVKPVRDTVLHSLQSWKNLPGPDSPQPSETGSSIKENFYGGDCSDLTSTSSSLRKDVTVNTVLTNSTKRRIPLSLKRLHQNCTDSSHSRADDWHIEIAVPKNHNGSTGDLHEESEGSSVTKTLERMNTEVTSVPDSRYEYVPIDDRQDCLSMSNLNAVNFETKFMTLSRDSVEESNFLKHIAKNQHFSADRKNIMAQRCSANTQDRQSLDSAITESSSRPVYGCCSHVASEMNGVHKQLLDIQSKQSSLLEHIRMLSTGIMNSMENLQSRLSGLEHDVDRITQVLVQEGRHSDDVISKLMKQNSNIMSPRLSTFNPRPSVDIRSRQPSLLSKKNSNICEEKTIGRRSVHSAKQGTEIWTMSSLQTARSALEKDVQKGSSQGIRGRDPPRKVDNVFSMVSSANAGQNGPDRKNCLWQHVKGLLREDDLDSAYAAALSSGDELVLLELLNRTGPVLESLSHKTVDDLLSTLTSYFLEQRFINSIIPWLQQLVELSMTHGPDCLILSAKTRREFLSAIQDVVDLEFSSVAERRTVAQLASNLRQLWG